MADELDLKVMRLEIQQLRSEIGRLEKTKMPFGSGIRRFAFMLVFLPALLGGWMHCMQMFGMSSVHSRTFHATVDGTLTTGDIRFKDLDGKTTGSIHSTGGGPSIDLERNEQNYVRIDSSSITLESDRGVLKLELNEKGEPVLRSIPAKKP